MKPSVKKYLFVLLVLYAVILLAACFWPFNFFQENRVAPGPEGLVFSEPGIVYTQGADVGLEELEEFTLVAELNLLVGLYVNHLIVETRRGQQTMRASIEGALQRGKRTWLVVVGTPGLLKVYLDGKLRREVVREQPDSTRWEASYPLVIGARSDGKYPWTGTLYRLGILAVQASPEEVQAPESLLASHPVMSYEFQSSTGGSIANAGTGEAGPLFIPELFVPFRRSSLMDIEDLWAPKPIWGDIILNILAFVPLGVILSILLGRAFHPVTVLLLVLVAAFGLSLCIEVLQVYLPRRWSTFTDVATNSFGALFGGIAWFLGAGRILGMKFRNAPVVPRAPRRDLHQ